VRKILDTTRRSHGRKSRRPLKTERTARKLYRTRKDEAKADVFDYIERFYNSKRRRSTIGYLSPMEFERQVGLA
jgi:putative transposase